MKRNTTSLVFRILALLVIFQLTACKDFLTLTPRDKKVVKTVEDYRDILASYMMMVNTADPEQHSNVLGVDPYCMPQFALTSCLPFYTGESGLATSSQFFDSNTNLYTVKGVQMLGWLDTSQTTWISNYKFLGPINLILKHIDTAEGNDEQTRDMVKGEALVWRAFTLYKLLQFYSPYHIAELGIPIFLDPTVDIAHAKPKRATQSEVYSQIVRDCEAALELLRRTPTRKWNCAYREDFIKSMLANVYMYKAGSAAKEGDDWKKAFDYSGELLKFRTLESDPARISALFDCSDPKAAKQFESDEFTVRIVDGGNAQMMNFVEGYLRTPSTGETTPEYKELFGDNDKRKTIFLKEGAKINKWKLSGYSGYGIMMPYRLADMYLIRAEAAIHLGNVSEATNVMRTFLTSRYNEVVSLPTSPDLLLKLVYDERKREFFAENDYIWLDMKRLGEQRSRNINGVVYTLEPNDFKYTFAIPAEELDKNSEGMIQNPGWNGVIH